jgi:putative spermidine/putrescine transport system substrate-binding protein
MKRTTARRTSLVLTGLAIVSVAALLTGCGTTQGTGGSTGPAGPAAQSKLGKMEGSVSILAWPGYVEDGSNDPAVDWVSAFEKETS